MFCPLLVILPLHIKVREKYEQNTSCPRAPRILIRGRRFGPVLHGRPVGPTGQRQQVQGLLGLWPRLGHRHGQWELFGGKKVDQEVGLDRQTAQQLRAGRRSRKVMLSACLLHSWNCRVWFVRWCGERTLRSGRGTMLDTSGLGTGFSQTFGKFIINSRLRNGSSRFYGPEELELVFLGTRPIFLGALSV